MGAPERREAGSKKCPACEGSGRDFYTDAGNDPEEPLTCARCGGRGTIGAVVVDREEPRPIELVRQLDCALHGETWARPQSPAVTWASLLDEVRALVREVPA